ncbi:stimulator of interferon genes protein isoform X2 [Rhipicephalus sanguineus]|uniref:stimulator of interferon genes protein isoform X2 n=1 Tax=Rhipicephalus sanguineus TaxID=34632 RepID=UPI001895780A|nr:stimulator of interferon genes protein isoform X2 [Rhipicephalus sanguineus]
MQETKYNAKHKPAIPFTILNYEGSTRVNMDDGIRNERHDTGMGPKRPQALFVGLFIIFVLVHACTKSPKEIGVQVAATAMTVLMVMSGREACYLLCELQRLRVKSASGVLKAAAGCFQLPKTTWLVILMCFVLSFLTVYEHPSELWDTLMRQGHVHFLVAFVTMLCVWRRTKFGWTLATSSSGPAPGHGLAYSVFFTYYRPLCLTLSERMTQYEQDNDVVLVIKKLIILMPRSCYIEPELGVGGDEDIEVANHMDELKISRAGTRERKYVNTVYKIRNGDDSPFYCVAEGASPLLTLNDMRECGELTAEQERAQMRKFCDKLRDLVHANAACRSRIPLVEYDDVSEDGRPVPVSSILRNIIRKELGLT